MNAIRATVTSKGQITLPKALRDSLGIHASDQIEFSIQSPQQAQMKKLRPAGASAGVLQHLAPSKPVSVDAINQAAKQAMRDRHRK